MEDTLYYVEGPDGEVLGPMTMLNILEGVAAGAVPEDARICEVGSTEWVDLADVAYAREDVAAAPAADARRQDLELTERWTHEPEAPASAGWAESHEEEETRAASSTDRPMFLQDEPEPEPAATHRIARDEIVEEIEPEPVYAEEPAPEVSEDFALELEHADAAPEEASRGAGRRIPVPALVAIAVAILGGAWLLVGDRLVSRAPREGAGKPAPAPVTTAPADPVDAAWALLAAGEGAKALETFRSLVEARPDDARAHHGLGLAALEGGKLELAGVHVQRAAELAPGNAMIRADLARAHLRAGRPELAVEEAERARSLDPAESAALLVLGRAHAAAQRPDDAVKALAAYVEAAPKHVAARRDLARALAAAGRVETAALEIAPYLQAHPEDREMQVARLDWLLAVGQQTTAAKLYPETATEDAFARYLAGAARTGTENGITHLRRAVALDPSHRDAWVRLAQAQAAVGRTPDAAAALRRAIALGPASDAEKKLLAEWSKPPAGPAPAVAATPAEPAPAATPASPPVPSLADRVGSIRRSLAREDFRGARRTIETARNELTGEEASRNLALWSAVTDFEEGRLDAAQKGFEALDASATYVGFGRGAVSNWLGRVLLARGELRAAIGVLDAVTPDDPDEYASAQLWQGIAMSALGMHDLAKRTWGRVHEDVGARVGRTGKAAVVSASFLAGAIAEKDYRTTLGSPGDFENDMHYFLGWSARADANAARGHFLEAMQASRGREFPYHLAQAEVAGTGLGR